LKAALKGNQNELQQLISYVQALSKIGAMRASKNMINQAKKDG